jgi:hypothetical protein
MFPKDWMTCCEKKKDDPEFLTSLMLALERYVYQRLHSTARDHLQPFLEQGALSPRHSVWCHH